MPKPFPFPLNIGTDICLIRRIRDILQRPASLRFVKRILTERERQETRNRWEAPIERYWQAERRRQLLQWKSDQLGLSKKRNIKQPRKGKNGWLGDAEKAKLVEAIERDEKVEIVDCGVELELDGDCDRLEKEASNNTEPFSATNTKFVVEKTPSEDAKKGKPGDKEVMLHLMKQNTKDMREAKVGIYRVAQFIAGRFAAKEAVIKAHHNRRLTYHSIAIHQPSSKPLDPLDSVQGSKAPYAVVISESGSWEDGQEVKLSISHDGSYATAVCMAYEPGPSKGTKVSTQDRRKPKIPQDTLSAREAAMLRWGEKYHGYRQVQLIQQEMERRQNLNNIVTRVAESPEANKTVEMKLSNQFEMNTSWTRARRRTLIRSNGAASEFWDLVSLMGAREKGIIMRAPSNWRPSRVLLIDGVPDGTSPNRLNAILQDIDKNFSYFSFLLANDTEGKSLGFALVRFRTETKAKLALEKARLFMFDGKPLTCRWMGKSSDVYVGEESAEGGIEAPTLQPESPIEGSDSERTNVDVEVEATDETDENTGAPPTKSQPTPVKTLTVM